MDLVGTFNSSVSQGPVFWAAAAAVAAGLTLLVVSLGLQIRKTFSGGFWKFNFGSLKKPSFKKINKSSHPEISITESGYDLAGKGQISNKAQVVQSMGTMNPSEAQNIAGLLLRLQKAGDQLEELHAQFSRTSTSADNSLLKHQHENVEYLIRTGIS